jgi:hypothetical protein
MIIGNEKIQNLLIFKNATNISSIIRKNILDVFSHTGTIESAFLLVKNNIR